MRIDGRGAVLIILPILAAFAACNKTPVEDAEEQNETASAAEPPHANMVVQPASLNLNQSSSTSISVGVTRINFSGPVTFSIEGAPAGVTGGTTSTAAGLSLVLTANASVVPGTYPIVVRQKGTNIPDNTANVTVRIAAPTGHSFTVSMSPGSVNLTKGQGVDLPVTVTRNGVTGSIILQAEHVPDFMAAQPSPFPAGATNATLSITTTTRIVAGTYQLFLRGSIPGETDVVFPFTVTVQ